MAELGSTYRCAWPPRHIYVIISDPEEHDGQFVLVNLTTLNESCVDDACILGPEDYPPFLTQPTTVAYSRYIIGNNDGMDRFLQNFSEMPQIPAGTLQKIIAGARISSELPQRAKDML